MSQVNPEGPAIPPTKKQTDIVVTVNGLDERINGGTTTGQTNIEGLVGRWFLQNHVSSVVTTDIPA